MPIARYTRFETDPANATEMQTRRAALIAAVRARFGGLNDTRLIRLDDTTWLDVWGWESRESMDRAVQGAHGLAEAQPAFALTCNHTAEDGEIVDER